MSDMNTGAKPKGFRNLIRVFLFLILLFALCALFGGGVSRNQIQRLERDRQISTALHEKIAAERNAATTPPITKQGVAKAELATTDTLKRKQVSPQERCDQLFLEIYGSWKPQRYGSTSRNELPPEYKPKAIELAALYDSGVRVSEKVKIGFCKNTNILLTARLADLVMKDAGFDLKQPPETRLKSIMQGAKYMRMIDMPEYLGNTVFSEMQRIIDPRGKAPSLPYPEGLRHLDLNLIAPKRAWSWRHEVPYYLELIGSQSKALAEQLSTFLGTYDFVCDGERPNETVSFLRTVCYLPFRHERVERSLRNYDELAKNADKIYEFPDLFMVMPKDTNVAWQIGFDSQPQAKARLMCAALELLRGESIPDRPLPDSYFYDIYTGGRIKIDQSPFDAMNVRFKLSSDCSPPGKSYPKIETSIILPANLPALKGLK